MYDKIRHDSSGLRDLLNKWKDYPDVFRALLLDGVEQLDLTVPIASKLRSISISAMVI
jgi:hypothetical protein